MRVRLIKTRNAEALPVGTLGTKVDKGGVDKDGNLVSGMHVIRWDWKFTVPMYRHEIEKL